MQLHKLKGDEMTWTVNLEIVLTCRNDVRSGLRVVVLQCNGTNGGGYNNSKKRGRLRRRQYVCWLRCMCWMQLHKLEGGEMTWMVNLEIVLTCKNDVRSGLRVVVLRCNGMNGGGYNNSRKRRRSMRRQYVCRMW